jgi:hypothetical protein
MDIGSANIFTAVRNLSEAWMLKDLGSLEGSAGERLGRPRGDKKKERTE